VENRDENGRFLPGVSGNPSGRPAGSTNVYSRIQGMLTRLYDEYGEKLETELGYRFNDDPVSFFMTVYYPLFLQLASKLPDNNGGSDDDEEYSIGVDDV
jgi:hypothetical protein